MFNKLLLFFFLTTNISLNADAQTDTMPPENWDVYLAQYEKSAGSVMLNMALKEIAPVNKYPYAVITGVTFKDCPSDGFPSKREFNNLYKISDSVKSVIEKSSEHIIAGSFTYQCERLDYYYVNDTTWVRQRLLNMYKTRFPNYVSYINIKADKNWTAYLDFLYPNEETLDYMGNEKILISLKKAGDKLEKARPVDHWAYFKTEVDRNCFIIYAAKNNFSITSKETSDVTGYPFKLTFSRTDKVDLSSISTITFELKKQTAKCNGSYDGWETILVK